MCSTTMLGFGAKENVLAFVSSRKIADFASFVKKKILAKSAILLWECLYLVAHSLRTAYAPPFYTIS